MGDHLKPDQVIGTYRRNVGAAKVATVHDCMLPTAFDDIVDADRVACEAAHRAAFRPMPPRLSCNTFVIELGGRLLLVDAGCGQTAPGGSKQRAGLASLGVSPDAVDVVLMTHLHRDHAAGLIDGAGQALFTKAELVVHEDELAFWQDDANRSRLRPSQRVDFDIAKRVLAAFAERLRPVAAGGGVPGVSAVPTPGHTPGHTAWLIDSGGEHLLIWGDVVHFPAIQFAHPGASVVYDLDSDTAASARRALLDRVAADRVAVAGVHLEFPCCGRVERAASGGFSYTAEVWESGLE